MTEIVTIASNAVKAKLHNPSREVKLQVQTILGYAVDGGEHSMAFKSGSWDGRSSFFDFRHATFPAGFVQYVAAKLRRAGYTVNLVRRPLPPALGPINPVVDEFPEDPRYDYQMDTVNRLLKHGQMIAQVATGGGKCLGRNTPVMMYDGSVKSVQNVSVGDWLMGPDSTPRIVHSTCAGIGPLYRVTPIKGDPYVVNDAHILSLKKTSREFRGKNRDGEKYLKGEVVNVNVKSYVCQNKTFKHIHKGWRTGVDFEPAEPLTVDPYFVGIILGDGTINGTVGVTTADAEIVLMLQEQAKQWGISLNVCQKAGNAASAYYLTAGRTGGGVNPLMLELRANGLLAEPGGKACRKFIPHHYKTASREDRLALLAGILDSDGYYDGKGFYLTLKEERLFDDTLFLARSLGFAAYKKRVQKTCRNNGVVGDYFSMTISGYLDTIPVRLERRKAAPRLQKKNPLVTGLSVEAIGEGDYYGFEIDGDRLFLLGDFTVTHNTKVAKLAYARLNMPTLFLTTRGILMYQMRDTFERDLKIRVSVLGDGQFGHTVTDEYGEEKTAVKKMCVGMVQTLTARLEEKTVEGELERAVDARLNKEVKVKDGIKAKMKGESPTAIKKATNQAQAALERSYPTKNKMIADAKIKVEQHMIQRAKTIRLLSVFGLVILEEAHEASGNSYYDILQHCVNANYRLALTATPFMKDSEESNMRLMACSGPVGIKITERMLIDRGILAQPHFKIVKLDKRPDKLMRLTGWQAAYRIGIVENEYRNCAIVAECVRMKRRGLSSMVLIQQTKHGDILEKQMATAGLRVEYIRGEDDQDGRKAALTRLAANAIDVLIGTTILDVGVDVPAVGHVCLAGGGKAEVALRQRIGRGLRAKKKGPNVCFVTDFADDFNYHLKAHASARLQIIESTDGFMQYVLKDGKDFDLDALGFSVKLSQPVVTENLHDVKKVEEFA